MDAIDAIEHDLQALDEPRLAWCVRERLGCRCDVRIRGRVQGAVVVPDCGRLLGTGRAGLGHGRADDVLQERGECPSSEFLGEAAARFPEAIKAWEQAGGSGPKYGQVTVCWAEDEDTAKKRAYDIWPNAAVKGRNRLTSGSTYL